MKKGMRKGYGKASLASSYEAGTEVRSASRTRGAACSITSDQLENWIPLMLSANTLDEFLLGEPSVKQAAPNEPHNHSARALIPK